jgi:hypothetical protein
MHVHNDKEIFVRHDTYWKSLLDGFYYAPKVFYEYKDKDSVGHIRYEIWTFERYELIPGPPPVK